MRTSKITRTTLETTIELSLNLDGQGKVSIDTPVPFFNHMLTALAFYAGFDLTVVAKGDTEVDDHHLVEDIGIVLGQALKEALGDKVGITRFASALTPMDDALSRVVLDISNRPMLVFDATFQRESIGGLSLENVREFLYALAIESRTTLHASVLYGTNDHHKVESLVKGIGRVWKAAKRIESDVVTSTKGVLE
jgi:imidazoleglycerol-phosphate dehydratase